jgi:AraC-like DNA-binding protein
VPWNKVVEFADPLACQAALQTTVQAEILPTTRGSFYAEATQIGMSALRLQRSKVALPQIGTFTIAPDRRSIGFLIEESSSNMQHCGLQVTPTDILIYGHDVVHQRSESDFRYGTMSLPTDDISFLCRTIIGRDFLAERRTSIVRPNTDLMSRLRALHKIVGQLAHDTPDLLELPAVRRSLEERLVHAMVRCLAEGAGVRTTIGDGRHGALVAKFEDFLAAHPNQPLYLTEICAGIDVAERTLRVACEEHLGMGPIRFLTLRRMHLVRRALLGADATRTSVTSIVTDHGFWELGRFSVAYRVLFGETPSETLRRPAEQPRIPLNRPSSLSTNSISGYRN